MREPSPYQNLKPIQKGERRGRKAGVPNKIPPLLKDAVLVAASQLGFDGMGKDGLVGYLKRMALYYPESFISLLGRLVRLQAGAAVDVPEKKSLIARSRNCRPLSGEVVSPICP
jgi:hypothetical protein